MSTGSRATGRALLRLATLPRAAPVLLLAAWMVFTAADSEDPLAGSLVGVTVCLTLLVADRNPVVPLVATFVGLGVADALGGVARDDVWITLLVCATFCVGRFGRTWQQWVAAFAVVLLGTMNVLDRGVDTSVGDVAFPLLFTGGPWLVGLALQTAVRRGAAAAERAAAVLVSSAAAVDRATAEERLRIARDLHDVVAHNISALSLQAQTARRRQQAGEEVDPAELRAIERSAQSAMRDLRQLLGVLRPTSGLPVTGPHEGLAQLPELIATAEGAGQRVRVTTTGDERELPPALSLAAYRILQESLANARRHAPGAPVTVRVEWLPAELAVEVRNPVEGPVDFRWGNGTAGMAERARLLGGEAAAGPTGDGDWRVTVRLPLPAVLETAP